jgi:thiamine-monophosphate kinase
MRKPTKPEDIRTFTERERARWLSRIGQSGRFPQLALGIGDDAALLRLPKGHQMVVTTDFSLEGVHFRRDWHSPQSAGHRCLARGLSDLAAMGAQPVAAFLSLALPKALAGAWADGFFAGLLALAKEHKIPLAGGDMASADRVLADIVLVGSVPAGKAMLRSTARAGDALYVTGSLGGAAAELATLPRNSRTKETRDAGASHPHLFPQPRVASGLALRKLGKRVACMDLSDGLAMDLSRLCEASRICAEVEVSKLPLAAGATLQQALTGGEDYELLFAAPASMRIPKKLGGVAVTRIGTLAASKPRQSQMTLVQPDGLRGSLEPEGWEYFK